MAIIPSTPDSAHPDTAHPDAAHPGAQIAGIVRTSLHAHWRLFLAEGVILCVLGIAAIALPLFAGLLATVFLGWLLFLAGVVGLVSTLRARHAPGYRWSLVSAIAAIAAGLLLLWNPLQGLVTLTFVLTAFFIIDGAMMVSLALAHRRELSGRWEWMLANGVVDLLLALLIIMGLPGTIAWAFGLLLGIDFVFGGASLIGMALQARRTDPPGYFDASTA